MSLFVQTTPSWVPAFVLPNIQLQKPIDGEMAAIANCQDTRVQQILTQIPVLAEFVRRFQTPFGAGVTPSMMILREDAPRTCFTVEAVSSFRDLVAMCVIPLSRARSAEWGRSFATYYTDWYEFYPWMINTHHQHIVCNTPALGGLELVEDFNGQTISSSKSRYAGGVGFRQCASENPSKAMAQSLRTQIPTMGKYRAISIAQHGGGRF